MAASQTSLTQLFMASSLDAPNAYVQPGQRVIVSFDTMWKASLVRKKISLLPKRLIHVKDFIKSIEHGYHKAWLRVGKVGMPSLKNFSIEIEEKSQVA
jgi:hypothetical protein